MGYENAVRARSGHKRSAVRRVLFFCALLTIPALILDAILVLQHVISAAVALLVAVGLLLYSGFVSASLIEAIVRSLQTLSNVVSSLREGDYSFRARGAGSEDALGELAAEVNALADLLQKQRVRSLEATALLARILEVMQSPIFAFDRQDMLQLVNNAGARLLGLPQARCFGRRASELGLGDLLAAPDASLHSFGVTTNRWLLRKAAFRQDGVPHTLLLLSDVSLPLRDEEQAAWKRLVRVLGHEISNSLAPIKSIAGSLLARMDQMSGDQVALNDFRRGLGVMESRADTLHRFVQSYRVLAQLPPPQLKLVPVKPLLERVILLEQRVAVLLAPDSDASPDVNMLADPDQLEQMFINLLANAADASLANGVSSVRIDWKLDDSSLLVTIEDRGLGIANSENLFVPFYTTKPTGSGVGLVLAQQIARAHGGEIRLVNREEDTGAHAIVRLPVT